MAGAASGCADESNAPFPAGGSDSWVFGVLPDTQTYSDVAPETFEAETAWFRDAAETELDLKMVLHVGDIVEHNSPGEWAVARSAFDTLQGAVPYVLAVGNHDMGENGSASDRTTLLDEYFPVVDFDLLDPDTLLAEGRVENAAHFLTPYVGSAEWMVLVLEFAPRQAALRWAESILSEHPEARTILLTHSYLYDDGTRYSAARADEQSWDVTEYAVGRDPDAPGAHAEEVYERLVRPHGQVELVLCGHVLGEGVAHRTSAQDDGGFVHEILSNYQHTDDLLAGVVRGDRGG
tara:strand:- start:193 stop:1068 length:876 start_codon:yes stop_codon:yes gene_type:complete